MAPRTTAPPALDPLPRPYFLFFTLLEPFLTILGSLYATFLPRTYFSSLFPSSLTALDDKPSLPLPVPLHPAAEMATRQLGSCFFLFAIMGAVMLPVVEKSLRDGKEREMERIVRAYLGCLAAADLTHMGFTLYDLGFTGAVSPLQHWNSLVWGNVGITAVLFAVRVLWFAGVGRGRKEVKKE
ncbi:hypothetical protein JCM6882_001959 [Rhodosporidiobolus microsporus]